MIKLTDVHGISRAEKTIYIQVNSSEQHEATKLLVDNNISYKTFDTASHAFCEKLAEAELRGIAQSEGFTEDTQDLMAIFYRDQVGKGLTENIGSFIDNGLVSNIATDIYYEDIVERVEVGSDEALELAKKLKENFEKQYNEVKDKTGKELDITTKSITEVIPNCLRKIEAILSKPAENSKV